jgi:hypothetical protein
VRRCLPHASPLGISPRLRRDLPLHPRLLERYQAEMRAVSSVAPCLLVFISRQVSALTVTTLESSPPPRTNALLLASPSTLTSEPASNHLYMLFGEFFDGSRVTFYNSVLRYEREEITRRTKYQYSAPVTQTRRSDSGRTTPGCRTFSAFVFSPLILGDIVSQHRVVKCDTRSVEE